LVIKSFVEELRVTHTFKYLLKKKWMFSLPLNSFNQSSDFDPPLVCT